MNARVTPCTQMVKRWPVRPTVTKLREYFARGPRPRAHTRVPSLCVWHAQHRASVLVAWFALKFFHASLTVQRTSAFSACTCVGYVRLIPSLEVCPCPIPFRRQRRYRAVVRNGRALITTGSKSKAAAPIGVHGSRRRLLAGPDQQ